MKILELGTRPPADKFAEYGVTLVGEILPPNLLAEVRARIAVCCEQLVPALPSEVVRDIVRFEPDGTTIKSVYYLEQVDEYFRELATRPEITDLVRRITG